MTSWQFSGSCLDIHKEQDADHTLSWKCKTTSTTKSPFARQGTLSLATPPTPSPKENQLPLLCGFPQAGPEPVCSSPARGRQKDGAWAGTPDLSPLRPKGCVLSTAFHWQGLAMWHHALEA